MNIRHLTRLMVIGVMILSIAASVMAASKNKGDKKGHHQKSAVMEQLNLTEAQKTTIHKIHEDARAEAQRIKQSNRTDEQKRADLRALKERTMTSIRNVLTPEQRVQFDRMHQERMGAGAGQGRGGYQRCVAKLDLTATQRSQAQEIRKTAQERIANIRSDRTLTDAQKRDRIASIQRVAQRDFLEILTPQQRTELRNCQSDHPGMGMGRVHTDKDR